MATQKSDFITHYETEDLADILEIMKLYVQDSIDPCDECNKGYFKEIIDTGLFHDAIGKIIDEDDDVPSVDVTEDY